MFDPKTPREEYPLEFEFSQLLTSISNAQVSVKVLSGNDPSPDAIRPGQPVVSGTKVFQHVVGGVNGTKYQLVCKATDGTKTFELAGSLEVKDFPV